MIEKCVIPLHVKCLLRGHTSRPLPVTAAAIVRHRKLLSMFGFPVVAIYVPLSGAKAAVGLYRSLKLNKQIFR